MDGCKLSFSFTLPDKTFQRVELVRELQLNISLLSLFFFFFQSSRIPEISEVIKGRHKVYTWNEV